MIPDREPSRVRSQALKVPRREEVAQMSLALSGVDVPPPISVFSLRGSLSPLLLIPIAAPVLVALFAPVDVLDRWSLARQLVLTVQRMLPMVNLSGHAISTGYAQVAQLTHCLTIVAIALTSIVWLAQSFVNYPYLLARRRALGPLRVAQHLALLFVGPPFMLLMIYAMVVLPGDPSFARGITVNNRLGFAVLTFFANYITGLVLGVQILNVRLFIDTRLRHQGHEYDN